MIRPERYKGCKVQVEGEAKESEAEIYINRVTSFKILSEPKQINIRD